MHMCLMSIWIVALSATCCLAGPAQSDPTPDQLIAQLAFLAYRGWGPGVLCVRYSRQGQNERTHDQDHCNNRGPSRAPRGSGLCAHSFKFHRTISPLSWMLDRGGVTSRVNVQHQRPQRQTRGGHIYRAKKRYTRYTPPPSSVPNH